MFDQLYQLILRVRHWLRLIPRHNLTNRDIQDLMYQHFPALGYQLNNFRYTCTTLGMMEWLIRFDWIDLLPYEAEAWDCNHYAEGFKSHLAEYARITAVGAVYDESTDHAYNLVAVWVTDRLLRGHPELRVLEPQNDRWVQPGQGLYLAQRGRVIW